jgi:hypothetical protein
MKYLVCQNSESDGKYFKGRRCYEEVLVDENTTKVLCWRCTAMLLPPPEEKKPSGYPRGWKFMSEFVDKDGNVYHKGELQTELFGTLPPTEIKETSKERKKKTTIDDKITTEFSKLVQAGKKKPTSVRTKTAKKGSSKTKRSK